MDTHYSASCKKYTLVKMAGTPKTVVFPAGPSEWCCGRLRRWRSSRTRAWPTSRCCASSWKGGCWKSQTIVLTCCKCHHCPAGTACASWPLQCLLFPATTAGAVKRVTVVGGAARTVSVDPVFYGSETFQKTTLLVARISPWAIYLLINKQTPSFVLLNKIRLNKNP